MVPSPQKKKLLVIIKQSLIQDLFSWIACNQPSVIATADGGPQWQHCVADWTIIVMYLDFEVDRRVWGSRGYQAAQLSIGWGWWMLVIVIKESHPRNSWLEADESLSGNLRVKLYQQKNNRKLIITGHVKISYTSLTKYMRHDSAHVTMYVTAARPALPQDL